MWQKWRDRRTEKKGKKNEGQEKLLLIIIDTTSSTDTKRRGRDKEITFSAKKESREKKNRQGQERGEK